MSLELCHLLGVTLGALLILGHWQLRQWLLSTR